MPSKALQHWKSQSQAELDEFVRAHTALGGEGRGRRYFTRQLNHAYLVAVAAQFQRFCRDLHTEAAMRVAGNAIVHQNFVLKPHHQAIVKGTNPDHVNQVRRWRKSCDELADQFDWVVRAHVTRVVAGPPWG